MFFDFFAERQKKSRRIPCGNWGNGMKMTGKMNCFFWMNAERTFVRPEIRHFFFRFILHNPAKSAIMVSSIKVSGK